MMRALGMVLIAVAISNGMVATPATAAGDFPLASCASWNGTIVEREGIDTRTAMIKGIITKADLQDYCERDPGGEVKPPGSKSGISQCVARHLKTESDVELLAMANCPVGLLEFQYGSQAPRHLKFPLRPKADVSCASGNPPLIAQFKLLCPKAASRMRLN